MTAKDEATKQRDEARAYSADRLWSALCSFIDVWSEPQLPQPRSEVLGFYGEK